MKAPSIRVSVAIKFTFLLLFALTFCVTFSIAQSLTSGDIAGSVLDPSGAAVPGATVTLSNLDTGAKQTATTSSTGAYRFALLNPGNYSIGVSATGFQAVCTKSPRERRPGQHCESETRSGLRQHHCGGSHRRDEHGPN